MQELTTRATLVDYETFEGGSPLSAVLARSELEAAVEADEPSQLWFEIELDDEDTRLLTIDLDTIALEQMLRTAGGDDILVAFDGDAVASMLDDADVEAHGIKAALAIAVAGAAIAAPTAVASVPQSVDAAAAAQQASIAATAQRADLAATPQVSRVAAKAQVAGVAAKAQVAGVAAKAQVNKQFVVKAAGLKLLRSGLAR
jgi:hypothetical protein